MHFVLPQAQYMHDLCFGLSVLCICFLHLLFPASVGFVSVVFRICCFLHLLLLSVFCICCVLHVSVVLCMSLLFSASVVAFCFLHLLCSACLCCSLHHSVVFCIC